ncbi:MAG: hypothetical protein RI637_12800, partial [Acidimicrobiia bacterium]|nr:hypothetical protein [Acidimicrobiia bacterium]
VVVDGTVVVGSAVEDVVAVAGGVVEDVGEGSGDGTSVTVTCAVAGVESSVRGIVARSSEFTVLVALEPPSQATSDNSDATISPTSAICLPMM